jgi:hypothetical protein
MAGIILLLIVLVLGTLFGALVTYMVLDTVLVDREVARFLGDQVRREMGLRQRLQSAMETLGLAARQAQQARQLQDQLAEVETVWKEAEASLDELKQQLKDREMLKLTNAQLEELWRDSEQSKAQILEQLGRLRPELDKMRAELDALRGENQRLQDETGRLRWSKSRTQYQERVSLLLGTLLPNLSFMGESVENLAFNLRDPAGALVLLRRLSQGGESLRGERVGEAPEWLELKYNDGRGEGRLYFRKAPAEGRYLVLVSGKKRQEHDFKNLKKW